MASIIDERGFNQGFKLTKAQQVRLRRRAESIVVEMRLPTTATELSRIQIMELGCGTGELAWLVSCLTGANVTGVDLSPKFIDVATATHARPNLRFVVANLAMHSPQVGDLKYDFIVGNGILHHLYYQLDQFLPALARWLAPRGKLIFWEPNLWNPYVFSIFTFATLRRWARLEPAEMAFTRKFIQKKLIAAGFFEIAVNPRDFLLPNIPAFLIDTVVAVGSPLEKIPVLRHWAQSIFICAQLPTEDFRAHLQVV